jgi:hypothetical protein
VRAPTESECLVAIVAGQIAAGTGRFALDDPGNYTTLASVDAAEKIVSEVLRRGDEREASDQT